MREKEIEGRRVVILADDLYEDLELWYPTLRLREEGAEVTIAAVEKREIQGKHGYPVTPDAAIEAVAAPAFDAIVIPGGYAPDHLRRDPAVLELVRRMHADRKLVAFICHAAWVPISAGILRGRRVAAAAAIRDDVVNAGAEFIDAEVVRDGNLVSSRKPADLGAFCREIISALTESETRNEAGRKSA